MLSTATISMYVEAAQALNVGACACTLYMGLWWSSAKIWLPGFSCTRHAQGQ